jgi:hypothetical protein
MLWLYSLEWFTQTINDVVYNINLRWRNNPLPQSVLTWQSCSVAHIRTQFHPFTRCVGNQFRSLVHFFLCQLRSPKRGHIMQSGHGLMRCDRRVHATVVTPRHTQCSRRGISHTLCRRVHWDRWPVQKRLCRNLRRSAVVMLNCQPEKI